jgi:hypothetical protein
MGAMSVFVKEGVPVPNKWPAMNPLTVNLPDGCKVQSMHIWDVVVLRLPRPLVGHIVPNLAIALLFDICPLCNVGCIVVFDKDKCVVWYDGKIISTKPWNMSTDLWTLPTVKKEQFATPTIPPAFSGPNISRHLALASFTHLIHTWMNAVKFAHQLLGNPWISTLLKADRWGFLNRCPNMSKKMILKYLNPSPATAKGHMKHSCQGIQNTTPKNVVTPLAPSIEASPIQMLPRPLSVPPATCGVIGLSSQLFRRDPTWLSMTTATKQLPMYLHFVHLLTKTAASCTPTSWDCSCLCLWTEVCASLSFTTTNWTAFSRIPSQG